MKDRGKYFYFIVLAVVLATSLYVIIVENVETTFIRGTNMTRSPSLPYSLHNHITSFLSQSQSIKGSYSLNIANDTISPNNTKIKSDVRTQDQQIKRNQGNTKKPPRKAARCVKKIQLWTYNAQERAFPTGTKTIKCPRSVCDVQVYSNKRYTTTKIVDAVILYHRTGWDWGKLRAARPRKQKWVFYSLECPLKTSKRVIPPVDHYNDTYDYIMSYRVESDILAGYGQYFSGTPQIPMNDTRNWAAGKPKMVAWVASNCRGTSWPRREFVANLSKHLSIDTYGRCGENKCAKKSEECEKLQRQYKFYLSLENSECTDYITEKFWNNIYRGMVPIVNGPPKSDYEKVAPPHSFIHIQDFETIKDLADYVIRVGNNDTLYNSYFDWKKRGWYLSDFEFRAQRILCGLGDRLVKDEMAAKNGTVQTHIHKDWSQWWTGSCFKGRLPKY